MRELVSEAEVVAASGDDDLVVWAAQGMRPGVRAWAYGDAVAVASPGASRRDRLVVRGTAAQVVPLVRHALAEAGPSYRPLGDAALIEQVVEAVPELEPAVRFSWMGTEKLAPPRHEATAREGAASWLADSAAPEVAALLAAASPDSYAVPGLPRVRRWAGVRDGSGALLAVAADAWSAPTVGLLAGVATAAPARGRGLGERVCRFVASALLAEHGRAALMVDDWNQAAVVVYERLGFARHRVAATGLRG
ncbi:GNAT family N-acetyltransferase [Microbispora sp. H10830]|uniref:GNAT family N-acetyltransferase n=1 Tax=Microbispora sp. H10830 TaxID=2729109 RepID=UPI001C7198AD|nr:GNAT family N-acetyltransferase [Microbispora sp. H10830]